MKIARLGLLFVIGVSCTCAIRLALRARSHDASVSRVAAAGERPPGVVDDELQSTTAGLDSASLGDGAETAPGVGREPTAVRTPHHGETITERTPAELVSEEHRRLAYELYEEAGRLDEYYASFGFFSTVPLGSTVTEFEAADEDLRAAATESRDSLLLRLLRRNAATPNGLSGGDFAFLAYRHGQEFRFIVGGQLESIRGEDPSTLGTRLMNQAGFALPEQVDLMIAHGESAAEFVEVGPEARKVASAIAGELLVERQRLRVELWTAIESAIAASRSRRVSAETTSLVYAADGEVWLFDDGEFAELDGILFNMEQERRSMRSAIDAILRQR